MLPAGCSLETNRVIEWAPYNGSLSGLSILVSSTDESFKTAWTSVLLIAGCTTVQKLPVKGLKQGLFFRDLSSGI